MNRFAMVVLIGVVGAASTASVMGGCGTDDVAIGPDIDASGSSSGSSGSNTDGSSSTEGGSDGTTSEAGLDGSTEAAPDATDDDGGLVSNPGEISCEGKMCAAGTEQCCRGVNDAGCEPAASMCMGISVTCDEKADCTGGMLCCGDGPGGVVGTTCKATCTPGIQICKTDAECPDGTCYINKCGGGGIGGPPGGGGGGGTVTIIPACSKIPTCTQ